MLLRFIKSISKAIGANTSLVFGLAAVPVLLAVGVGVDYSEAHRESARAQAAIDAATLAVAKFDGNKRQRKRYGRKVFNANFVAVPGTRVVNTRFRFKPDGTIVGTVKLKVDTSFMKMASIRNLKVVESATVKSAGIGKAEVVFVLDYSSSMNGQYVAMREAAINLINDLSKNGTNRDVKFGLVPFAREVYVSMPGQYVTTGTPGVTWSNCTVDRFWPFTVSEDTPTGLDDSKWGRLYENPNPQPADYNADCQSYINNNLTTRPLTDNHAGTIAQLRAMTPHSGTNVAVGMQIGWQVLSPNAPFTEGVPYTQKDTKKVIILLTDGEHNKKGRGPGGVYTSEQGFANVDTVCNAVKAKDVTMVTVAYELESQSAKNQLRRCASESQFYLEGNEQNIATIFDDIGDLLANEIYLSK